MQSCNKPLEVAVRVGRAEENLNTRGEVYIFQSTIALLQSDTIRARDYVRQALPLLIESDLIDRWNYATYRDANSLIAKVTYHDRAERLICAYENV